MQPYHDKAHLMPHMSISTLQWFVCAATVLLLFTKLGFAQDNLAMLKVVFALQHPTSQIEPVRHADPYLNGVIALRRGDAHRAEQFFISAVNTRHAAFAEVELIRLWGPQREWGRIFELVESSYPIERNVLMQIPVEHIQQPELTQFLNHVVKHAPETLPAFAHRLLASQRFVEAEQWARSVKEQEQQLEAQRIVALSLFYQHRFADAQIVFQPLYDHAGGKSADLSYWYGRSLLYGGDPQRAIGPLEQATTLERNAWHFYELSNAYAAVGRCVEARQLIDRALRSNTDPAFLSQLQTTRDALKTCD